MIASSFGVGAPRRHGDTETRRRHQGGDPCSRAAGGNDSAGEGGLPALAWRPVEVAEVFEVGEEGGEVGWRCAELLVDEGEDFGEGAAAVDPPPGGQAWAPPARAARDGAPFLGRNPVE